MSVSWQDRLDDANNVHEVVEITKDFLATWDRHEIAALPEPCRPGKMFDANDVTSYAFQLMQFECGRNPDAAPLMRKLTAFFSNASVRLTEILAFAGNADKADSRQSA